ncbi:hypothetical protein OPV22_012914 [Ensete ventricosum]|uniref:Secreted protein n=1 Tax=Ensete ventricosum TaxID=4639 RepID=A0AAV8QZU5_ENSVE|nr:hypothetical protein OPV22_012914 [Ensete ventricosum]
MAAFGAKSLATCLVAAAFGAKSLATCLVAAAFLAYGPGQSTRTDERSSRSISIGFNCQFLHLMPKVDTRLTNIADGNKCRQSSTRQLLY